MESHTASRNWRLPSPGVLFVGASALLFAAYFLVIYSAIGSGLLASARDAAINVSTLAGLTVLVHAFLKSTVMSLSVQRQVAIHAGLASAFALAWYALVVVLLAFVTGLSGGEFKIVAFARPAFVWQVFQGFSMYGLVAAVCYALRGAREASDVTIIDAPPLERYLTRIGDDIVPVETREIVSITGAQDYAEVVTARGRRHLVRLSLAEFEARLDRHRFVRVHRSIIINLCHFTSAEPAGGGRMLAHMSNGDSIKVSRNGAQALRDLMV